MRTPDPKYAGKERRDFPRLKGMLLEYAFSEEGERTSAFVKNIGGGGLCFVTTEKIIPEEEIFLYVYIAADAKPAELVGRIAWARPIDICQITGRQKYEAGVEFLDGSFNQYKRIVDYLLEHNPTT